MRPVLSALVWLLGGRSAVAGCAGGHLFGGDPRTIHKDVVIIGGGGSGAYSAVRLREDFGLSVVVVEQDTELGGHVNTWIDPSTGRGFEAGVQSYIDIANATQFFKRLGVNTAPNNRPTQQAPVYVDFGSGRKLNNYTPPSTIDRNDALLRYLSLAEKALPIMEPGWWTFPPPEDIPADLLSPFRNVVEKYNLTAAVPQMFLTTGFGMHDMMDSPTIWVMRSFGVDICRTILGLNAGFVPTSGKNQDLYDAILGLLGADVMLSTTTISTHRTDGGVTLKVRNTVSCEVTEIVAKKLLFTAAPTKENLDVFSLDAAERSVFESFNYSTAFVGVVSHPSLPRNVSVVNMPEAAQGANWAAAVPMFPYTTRFDNFANSSYHRVVVVGDATLDEEKARASLVSAFDRMVQTGTIKQTDPPQPLNVLYFKGHGLVNAHVPPAVLQSGFIQKLTSLQGRRSTWYTGAAWSVHITTSLWVFTDTLLPKLVASL